MTSQFTTEMSECLKQMTNLQLKMENLEKEKNKIIADETIKRHDVEPNIQVISNWLETHSDTLDTMNRDRVIIQKYNELNNINITTIRNLKQKISSIGVCTNEDFQNMLQLYNVSAEDFEIYQHSEIINEEYSKLRQRNKTTASTSEQRLHNIPTFQDRRGTATYFMKEFIEATHNLFVIQQNRIDDLENKINMLSSTPT